MKDTIRVAIDPDLRELIPGFLENRRNDVRRLHGALTSLDFETIRILGHRMRGDGGGYGFDRISTIGHAIEQAAGERNLERLTTSVEELTQYLDRLEVVYE